MAIYRRFVAALIAACIAWAPINSAAHLRSAGINQAAVSITGGTSVWDVGAVGSPSISGVGNLTTGLYWTTNTLNIAAAGSQVASFGINTATFQGTWGASPVAWGLGSGGAGNSNRAAMGWNFTAGLGTGNGAVGPFTFSVSPAGASGTNVNAAVTASVIHNTKSISNNSATAMVNFTAASNTVAAGTAHYAVEIFDGTNLQIEVGVISFAVINKAGVFSGNTVTKTTNTQSVSSGTLTVTWTITAANPAVLTLNANSSLTPSAGYPRITYDLSNLTQQAIALQ